MAIKHLVLHVGVPKTGTSLIQRSLRQLRPQLRQRGIAYVDRRQIHRLEHRTSWGAYATGPESDKPLFASELEAVVRSEERKVQGRTKSVLLSNESIIGRVAPTFGDPYWPRAADGLGEMIEALSPKRTDVIIYVRRQDRLLESMFMQQLHLGKSLNWEDFIGEAGRDDRVRYRDVMEVISAVPTVGKVRIRPFEIIGAGAAAFVADFLSDLEASDLLPHIKNFGQSNPSYTQPAWEAAQHINPHLRTEEQRDDTRAFLKKLFPPADYPKAVLLTAAERQRILEIYASENQAFFRDYLPDYPVDSYLNDDATGRLRAALERIDLPVGT